MWLHAHSVAADVPARFDARVHSVFRHAINVQLPEGSLVPIVSGRDGPVGGIGLSGVPACDLSSLCAAGQASALRAGVLRIGPALSVSLHGATVHRPSPPPFCWEAARADGERAWRAAWEMFHAQPPHLASRAMRERIARMVMCVRRDTAEFAKAASALAGLGPGLTPAGDDALVGWLCAFSALGNQSDRLAAMRDELADCIRCEAERTTIVSRHYLLHAARGETGAHLNTLVRAISEGDAARTRDATAEALAVGATSGADGVLGLLTALAAAHAGPAALLPPHWTQAFPTAA